MTEVSSLYDMSGYPSIHPCFQGLNVVTAEHIIKINKRVVGKMKDELKGLAAHEFVGLRPKLYSLAYYKDRHFEIDEETGKGEELKESTVNSITRNMLMEDKKTAKGCKKTVKEAHLRHEHYRECLNQLSTYKVKQNLIKLKLHTLSSVNAMKVALTACDDGVHTYAHGH